jgi:hypothetical protein
MVYCVDCGQQSRLQYIAREEKIHYIRVFIEDPDSPHTCDQRRGGGLRTREPGCEVSSHIVRFMKATLVSVLPIAAMSVSSMAVPARMAISQTLARSLPDLYEIPMVPLKLGEDRVEHDVGSMTLQDVAKSFGKESVAFVVRRPG